MNKKILFSALVAATLTACTSEEAIEPASNTAATGSFKEVVGANLASKGLSIGVNNGETTRVNAQGWESTDKVGLAWIDNGVGDITAAQGSALADFANLTDNKIYANTILNTEDGGKSFQTKANVYEGAYFVYSPWAYKNQNGELTFEPNATTQAADVNTERYAKLPWMSGLKFIAADKKLQEGELNTTYTISPIANTLRVTATPQGNIASALAGYYIKTMSITDVTENVFRPTMTVDPTQMVADGGDMDHAVVAMAAATTAEPRIVTTIEPGYAPLTAAAELRSFILPTAEPTLGAGKQNTRIFLCVAKKDAKGNEVVAGEFTIVNTDFANYPQTAQNYKTLDKLNLALDAPQALYAKSLTEILRNDNDQPVALGLPVDLTVANFHVTLFEGISNLSEWNEAVALFDALHAGEKDLTAEFTLDGEVEFDGDMAVPATAKVVNVTTTGAGKMSLKKLAKATMSSKIQGASANVPFEVKATAQLTVNTEGDKKIDYTIDGNGSEIGVITIDNAPAAVVPVVTNHGYIFINCNSVKTDNNGDAVVPDLGTNGGVTIFNVTADTSDDAKGKISAALNAQGLTNVYVTSATYTLNEKSASQAAINYRLIDGKVNGANKAALTIKNVSAKGTSVIASTGTLTTAAITNDGDLTLDVTNGVTTGAIVNKNALTINGTDIAVGGITNNTDKVATSVAVNTNSKDAATTIELGDVKNTNANAANRGTTRVVVSNKSQDTSKQGTLKGSKDDNTTLVVNTNVVGTLN